MPENVVDEVSELLHRPEFWRFYVYDEAGGFDPEEMGTILQQEMREKVGAPPDDEDDDDSSGLLKIALIEVGRWRLTLNAYIDDIHLHELRLGEVDAEEYAELEASGELEDALRYSDDFYRSHELGHWDQARWHPFCVRWDEVEAIVSSLRHNPESAPVPPGSEHAPLPEGAVLLLLSRFVGVGAEELPLLPRRRQVVADTLEGLGAFSGPEAVRMAELLLPTPPEDDYSWSRSADGHWEFGGDYPCYSNRNSGHSFPFEAWEGLRSALGLGAAG